MTVAATTRKAGPFAGDGTSVTFAFSYKIFTTADVLVVLTSTLGVETVQTLTTDYTVSMNANQNVSPGGTVTMLVAPATGELLTLGSQVAQSQGTQFTNGGSFEGGNVTDALDRAMIVTQQLSEAVSRSIQVDISSSVTPAALLATISAEAAGATTSANAAAASAVTAANTAASVALGDIGAATHAATSKTTPVDADEIPISDSAAAWVMKKLTWANIKATLKAYFDPIYSAITGVTDGSDAAAGDVGEYVETTTPLSYGIPASNTPVNCASLTLSAGDWEVWGIFYISAGAGGASSTLASYDSCVTQTSATFPATGLYKHTILSTTISGGSMANMDTTPRVRFSLSANTTVYLAVASTFSGSAMHVVGRLFARRMR